MQKILKNEKGSISLFVLLTALFFLVVVTGVGVSFKNKEVQIDSQFEKIKASYEKNPEQVYNSIYSERRAIFKTGSEVNAKMKQLAGDVEATKDTNNTTIKAIKRSLTIEDEYKTESYIVSSDDSSVPIYMWYNNDTNTTDYGTIYYYSEIENIEMNNNANFMFYRLKNIDEVELDTINTAKTTSMNYLFAYSSFL